MDRNDKIINRLNALKELGFTIFVYYRERLNGAGGAYWSYYIEVIDQDLGFDNFRIATYGADIDRHERFLKLNDK